MDISSGGPAGGVIGAMTEEMAPVAEGVKQEVTDSVGQAIEAGVQSVMGTVMDPQQIQKKEEDRQKKIAEVRWRIQQLNRTNAEIEQIRKEKEQKEKQRIHAQVQEQQQKKQMQMQQTAAAVNPALANITEGRPELKKGVGG